MRAPKIIYLQVDFSFIDSRNLFCCRQLKRQLEVDAIIIVDKLESLKTDVPKGPAFQNLFGLSHHGGSSVCSGASFGVGWLGRARGRAELEPGQSRRGDKSFRPGNLFHYSRPRGQPQSIQLSAWEIFEAKFFS